MKLLQFRSKNIDIYESIFLAYLELCRGFAEIPAYSKFQNHILKIWVGLRLRNYFMYILHTVLLKCIHTYGAYEIVLRIIEKT